MGEFIQIMRFQTDDIDTITKESDQYREHTSGRSTYTSEVLGRDLDTGEYVVIVRFPSKEAAETNNNLPETQALAERMASSTQGLTFSNVEVVDERS